jgi:hypothetical protein
LTPVTSGYKSLQTRSAAKRLENIYFARIGSNDDPVAAAKRVAGYRAIDYAEPMYYHYTTVIPNDPSYLQQSFFDLIEAQQAWDVVKGSEGSVVIAIVDGGTDIDHPDLMSNIWTNPGEVPGNNQDDDDNGFVDDIHGWNFANDSNDPTGLANTPGNADHGTHTAGLAAAVTNNGIGVAGASWNAKIMAINVSSDHEDLTLGHLTKGILYAMNNGADIISLSLGHSGGASAFEQDLINTATDMGIAVIAAAGNDNNSIPHFPSSYKNVLSVAATGNTDRKAGFSNYGPTVDVTAPGFQILSTINNGLYGEESGTSMSTPIVSGLAALLLTQHRDWIGVQALEQIRVTADDIDDLNPSYRGQLGFGRVNARRAVTEVSPSIRVTGAQFSDQNLDGIIQPGEQVEIALTVRNYLATSDPFTLTIEHTDPNVTLAANSISGSGLGTLAEVTLPPIVATISENAPSGHPVNFSVQISAGVYQDRDSFRLTILPTFGNLAGNNIGVTVTNVGRIGFGDPNDSGSGIGFTFENGPNLLFEGSIIAGTGPQKISNAARNAVSFDDDFSVTTDGEVQIFTPGIIADQESLTRFDDSKANDPMNIRITQETYASDAAENTDFVVFRYNIENLGMAALQNFHFGFFFDWDLDAETFATNVIRWTENKRLGYVYDSGTGPGTFAGVSLLTDGGFSFRAIHNDETHQNNPSWGVYDNFTDAEKWEAISGGVVHTNAGPADVSFSIGTGPFTIGSNELLEVAFAMIAGTNETDLHLNADRARAYWESTLTTAVEDGKTLPAQFSLAQNYPNPFNPATRIIYDIAEGGDVRLTIFNLKGQEVTVLVAGHQSRGTHRVTWDGRDRNGRLMSAGLYIYRLESGNFVESRRMLFLK